MAWFQNQLSANISPKSTGFHMALAKENKEFYAYT